MEALFAPQLWTSWPRSSTKTQPHIQGDVEVPALGMVDDVLSVTKCSNTVITTTVTINSFMEFDKLKLAAKKCAKIHIGKKVNKCPIARVHQEEM